MNLEIKPIGIIGAMDNEIELLKSSMDIKKMEAIAGMTYYCGTLCEHDAVLVRCGIGKVNAAICAQTLITHFGVGRVINTGVAGSLDKDINICVCDRNKKKRKEDNIFYARYNIEVGRENDIPIWMFGFLY